MVVEAEGADGVYDAGVGDVRVDDIREVPSLQNNVIDYFQEFLHAFVQRNEAEEEVSDIYSPQVVEGVLYFEGAMFRPQRFDVLVIAPSVSSKAPAGHQGYRHQDEVNDQVEVVQHFF